MSRSNALASSQKSRVTPLKILNQGEQTGALPRDLQDQTGNLFQAADHGGPRRRSPGNELIAPTALAPDGKGLGEFHGHECSLPAQ